MPNRGEREIALVIRDHARRPRQPWRAAWVASRHHDLSTISTWQYARDAREFGGLQTVGPALLVYVAGGVLAIALAFGAAALANRANGTTSSALLILGSVVLSRIISMVDGRKLPRRAVIAAYERAASLPPGVHRTWIEVRADDATRLSSALRAHGFLYTEQIYYREGETATLVAEADPSRGHIHEQAADALGSAWHRLGNILCVSE